MGDETNVVKLPLWRTCCEQMLEEGIGYGKTYKSEFFEQALRAKRNTPQFGYGVYRIRRELERKGFFLNGVGLSKTGHFTIQQASSNRTTMVRFGKSALRAMTRGVILGTNTPLNLLTTGERRKHEQITERLALRLMFAKRASQVAEHLGSERVAQLKRLSGR